MVTQCPLLSVAVPTAKLTMHSDMMMCLIFECFFTLKPRLDLSPVKCVVVPSAKLSMHFHLLYYILQMKTDRRILNGRKILG